MRKTSVLLSGILCAILLSPLTAEESDRLKNERTITVQGQGKVSAVPDIATLSVEVQKDGAELDPVLTQVRQLMNKVLASVKAQGIEEKDVKTDLFQVHPKYEQDKRGNPHPTGYVVANSISVKVRDLKKTGKVLSAVLDAGATRVQGPDFEIDNPQMVERLALAAATKDAEAKAQAITQAAGVQLGDILEIHPEGETGPVRPRPLMMRAMAMPAAVEAEEPMEAGEQTLSATVTITFAIH